MGVKDAVVVTSMQQTCPCSEVVVWEHAYSYYEVQGSEW